MGEENPFVPQTTLTTADSPPARTLPLLEHTQTTQTQRVLGGASPLQEILLTDSLTTTDLHSCVQRLHGAAPPTRLRAGSCRTFLGEASMCSDGSDRQFKQEME